MTAGAAVPVPDHQTTGRRQPDCKARSREPRKSQESIDEGATVFERCRAAGSIHSVCRHMELAGEGSVLAAASSSRLCLEGSALYLATWLGQKKGGNHFPPFGPVGRLL